MWFARIRARRGGQYAAASRIRRCRPGQRPASVRGQAGLWEVVTQTSRYILDLDSGTAQRNPGAGLAFAVGGLEPDVADLRGDGLLVPLVGVVRGVVGDSMLLLLRLRDDGVVTVRATTLVRSIRRLGRNGPDAPSRTAPAGG